MNQTQSRWRRGFVTSLLFPAPQASYTIDSFPGELVWVPKGPVIDPEGYSEQSCESCPCLLLPYESARFLIIFFHSNAEDLGRCRWFCLFLRDQFQVHVLAVEYPGYGVCPGNPSREAIMANAHAALQFATQALKLPLDRIKLFGRSIGTGPTLALAAKFRVAGVILVTPFLSVRALFREKVGPLSRMIEEWFSNDEAMKEVRSPTIIIHGRKDILIPHTHGEALYESCQSRKLFINPLHMEHNTNLTSDISFLIVPMFRFFALPDYSFQELKVPSWAYDKRRSPLYVRPDVQVASSKEQVFGDDPGVAGTMYLPMGDDADTPVDEDRFQAAEDSQPALNDDGYEEPPDNDKLTVLTHPTVLHTYSATKQIYHFQEDPRVSDARHRHSVPLRSSGKDLKPGGEVPFETTEDVMRPRPSPSRQELQVHIERRSALGDRLSATKPSSAKLNTGPPPAGRNGAAQPQPPRGASSGLAYTVSQLPDYDGNQPTAPKESQHPLPMLSQMQSSDEDDDAYTNTESSDFSPDGALATVESNGPRAGPRVAPKPAQVHVEATIGHGEPTATPEKEEGSDGVIDGVRKEAGVMSSPRRAIPADDSAGTDTTDAMMPESDAFVVSPNEKTV